VALSRCSLGLEPQTVSTIDLGCCCCCRLAWHSIHRVRTSVQQAWTQRRDCGTLRRARKSARYRFIWLLHLPVQVDNDIKSLTCAGRQW